MLRSPILKFIGLISLIVTVIFLFLTSLAVGQTAIPLSETWEAIISYDPNNTNHLIIGTSRLSRGLISLVIGMNLALAGVFVQALTRNPLAAPDLLGINAGAIFFIVFAITWLEISSLSGYMWFAFLGAAIAGGTVFFLGSLGRDGLTPIKVILAGVALSALFVSFTQGMLVLDEQSIQTVLFWISGSVAGRDLEMLLSVLPFLLTALVISLFMARPMGVFSSGDDVAKGLGQKVWLTKLVMGMLVIVLAGGSVAVVGSVGFIGLIVPHMAKSLVGNDYRWILPYSGLLGAVVLLAADIIARVIIAPQEVPIGVMTAFIGGPFFIYLAKKGVSKK
ncbi:FecCD family ABC transporter permease [Jeotgalibacillus haloalkalitolerans]|uniref:Iron ABC transporter permease n=1 Tax=Jeotgalibacillus haloalkalitolerans TaxID=3104292 RepID=A0ABU5KHR4_9BACL|nr:iron ABC transporter permease [Jeotgalibacillus sp. HH7-29]MDZ5710787.1 iron ABC transporter permease [Jeotgalibacillus sp. HH7-29]